MVIWGALGVLTFAAMILSNLGAAKGLSHGQTLHLQLAGDYPERLTWQPPAFMDGVKPLLRDLDRTISAAAQDDGIKDLLLRINSIQIGSARLQDLRRAIAEFRSTGKQVTAYLEDTGLAEYALACSADKIIVSPLADLDLKGMSLEIPYLKGTLDKLGVAMDIVHIGDYKTAYESFARDTMSDTERQQMEELALSIWSDVADRICAARNLTRQEFDALVDQGPFTAERALAVGLIDRIAYPDEIEAMFTHAGQKKPHTVDFVDYANSNPEWNLSLDKIAVVVAEGTITSGGGESDMPFGGSNITPGVYCKAFKEIREDDSIKAVVFRIDSGGGSAYASELIWREVFLTNQKKPVIASFGSVAASGGYYIATGCRKIVAEDLSITGSIGVVSAKPVVRDLYGKAAVNIERISFGQNAGIYSASEFFTPEQREVMTVQMNEVYETFLNHVAEARGKTRDEVHEVAQGRIWTGRRALELGLIDELGGFNTALGLAKSEAGLATDKKVGIVSYPESGGFREWFLSQSLATTGIPADALSAYQTLTTVERLSRERILAIAPFIIAP